MRARSRTSALLGRGRPSWTAWLARPAAPAGVDEERDRFVRGGAHQEVLAVETGELASVEPEARVGGQQHQGAVAAGHRREGRQGRGDAGETVEADRVLAPDVGAVQAAVAPQHTTHERIVDRRRQAVQVMAIADRRDRLAEVAVAQRGAGAGPLAGLAVDATELGEIGDEAGDRLGGHRRFGRQADALAEQHEGPPVLLVDDLAAGGAAVPGELDADPSEPFELRVARRQGREPGLELSGDGPVIDRCGWLNGTRRGDVERRQSGHITAAAAHRAVDVDPVATGPPEPVRAGAEEPAGPTLSRHRRRLRVWHRRGGPATV